jgi:regulator of cell morphogenesis and NO signaling
LTAAINVTPGLPSSHGKEETKMLSTEVTLADLAVAKPGAARIFLDYRLDFCCRGRRPLAEACAEKGLDANQVLQAIERQRDAAEDLTPWNQRPLDDLIDHVVGRYHGWLRTELPGLLQMARKVEAVHAEKTTVPTGLATHLDQLHAETLAHLQKEETILFPMIRRGQGRSCGGPIQVMEAEHRDVGAALERVRSLTANLSAPPEACTTWRALYLGLGQLEKEFMEHIHLENNILFPRALCR